VKEELARLCGLYNPVQLQHTAAKSIPVLRETFASQPSSSGRKPAAQSRFFLNEASPSKVTFFNLLGFNH
jgi:hypothetical protein